MIDIDNAVLIVVTVLLTEFGKDLYSKVKKKFKEIQMKKLKNVRCPDCMGPCSVRKYKPHFKCRQCGLEFD